MTRWFFYAISLIVMLFVGGWGLVVASGHGGNRTGGSHLLWQVGGLMVYASVICVPICLIAGVVALSVEHAVHGSRASRGRGD
jgi:hypothetical protein